jgi:SAM-dependent methyltransferase
VIGARLPLVAEELCEAVDLRSGERVLDVATGTGNAAIAAARRWCSVTGIDYVPALLERGRARAETEGVEVDFREGDAEAIPFASGVFDVVLSTFGVMFAPDQERAAAELARVCRPGGRIGLASWTPEGFIGEMFRVVGKHVPPAPGVRSPALWGAEARLRELFGDGARELAVRRKFHSFRYPSAEHFVATFRRWYGPTVHAFAALEGRQRDALAGDLRALLARRARDRGPGLVVDGEYLEAVVTRA